MPFDRQALADLRRRMLAEPGPTAALAAEARGLVGAAGAAGDATGEFEAAYLLLTLLGWQGAVEAAAGPLDRLQALAPAHPALFAQRAEFARLAGDRREAARHCAEGWEVAEAAPMAEGRGLLLGCWAWASPDPEGFERCLRLGTDLDAPRMSDLDLVAFHSHVADAALDLEEWDVALEQAAALVKAFAPPAPPLAYFLWRRTVALHQVTAGEFDHDLGRLLRELVAEAERNGWTAWLPALDAALALAPED